MAAYLRDRRRDPASLGLAIRARRRGLGQATVGAKGRISSPLASCQSWAIPSNDTAATKVAGDVTAPDNGGIRGPIPESATQATRARRFGSASVITQRGPEVVASHLHVRSWSKRKSHIGRRDVCLPS
jgi:hypothetical protein